MFIINVSLGKYLMPASLVILSALIVGCSSPATNQATKSAHTTQLQTRKPFDATAPMVLTAHTQRMDNGQVVISGTTNLPDNLKMWVEVEQGRLPLGAPKAVASDNNVVVTDGKFTTVPLWLEVPNTRFSKQGWPKSVDVRVRQKPFPAGQYKVHFESYFNGAWQTPSVLAALRNAEGKNLKGQILKATDSDVTDSPKTVDYRQVLSFGTPSPEAVAISLVRAAVLTVPGEGRSAGDIQANIDLYLVAPGMRLGKGWSAKAKGQSLFEVSYDFINGDEGKQQAIWTANVSTGNVKYVNENAKTFSWTPNY